MPNDLSPLTQSILAKIAAVPVEPPPDDRYRYAILSSPLAAWYSRQTYLAARANPGEPKPPSAERIPIPQISVAEQRPFTRLVDEILAAKRADAGADTRELEWRLDELVYALYGLTEAEETAIERSLRLIHATDEAEDGALLKWMQEGKTGKYVSREAVMKTLRSPDGS